MTHGWSNSCGPVAVEGTGWVKLRSNNPMDAPRILCNYLSTDYDIKMMHRALELNREDMSQPAFKALLMDELEPGFHVKSKSDIHEYILNHVAGDYHPVGTNKVGADDDKMAVVDPLLRVFGIERLHIANANTNSTSIMIGKRAADLILSA